MAAVNKHSSHKSNNSIVDEIVSWISGIISKAKSSNKNEERASNSYFECEEYERQQIRKAAQQKINQIKYQSRRSF